MRNESKWQTCRENRALTVDCGCSFFPDRSFGGKHTVDFGHDFEGVGNVEDVGFAASPSTVWVEIDGATIGDEAPADDVGFLAMTAGGKTFRMTRSRTGLTHLVEVGEKTENCLAFSAEIDKRLAAAERGIGVL